MTSWHTGYWRVFNVLVRAFGLIALLAGVGFMIWGVVQILELGLWPEIGVSGLLLVAVGLLAAGLGAAALGAPNHRPDLGDPAWQYDPSGVKTRESSVRRSWWTGDR
jgi:hypothetical protein